MLDPERARLVTVNGKQYIVHTPGPLGRVAYWAARNGDYYGPARGCDANTKGATGKAIYAAALAAFTNQPTTTEESDMNANTIRPIEVNDRAEVAHRNPDNGEILNLRGTVVDITNGIAILDLDDDGGRYSTPVEALERVEQVYLAGGDLAIDADAHKVARGNTAADVEVVTADGRKRRIVTTAATNGKSSPNHIGEPDRAVYFAASGAGITMCVVDVDANTTHPVVFGFGAAGDLHRALGELLYNPANDYTAVPPNRGNIRAGDVVTWTRHDGQDRTATVESVNRDGVNAYVVDSETGVTTYVGTDQLRRA